MAKRKKVKQIFVFLGFKNEKNDRTMGNQTEQNENNNWKFIFKFQTIPLLFGKIKTVFFFFFLTIFFF